MIRGLVGRKIGMTQTFNKEGNVFPVTLIEASVCTIVDIKETPKKKISIGFEPVKESRIKKPQLGFFKKIGVPPMRGIKEFDSTDNKDYKVGQQIKADIFRAGECVDVSGISIGKGFQGGMKRWHWSGGPAGHGSMHHRRVGSIGASADPSKTLKGTHMPGHMGAKSVTVKGLRVIDVDAEKNLIAVHGAVPGHKNALLVINRSLTKPYKDPNEKKEVVVRKINPMKLSKAKHGGKKKKKKK